MAAKSQDEDEDGDLNDEEILMVLNNRIHDLLEHNP